MMPTVLLILGWRVYFFSNERNEPIHVHARKGDAECKYFLREDIYDIEEAWSYNLSPRLRIEIRKIIFDHFDLIVSEWHRHMGGDQDAKH